MLVRTSGASATLAVASALSLPFPILAQAAPPPSIAQADLPDAPQPQYLAPSASIDPAQPQTPSTPDTAAPTQPPPANSTPAPTGASAGSSTTQPPAAETDAEKTKREEAEQQIKQQEKQRVLGVVPNFNISYINNAVSLTATQKLSLAFRSAIDPATFGLALVVAGYHEALDEDVGFRWGPEGYMRRSGAAYLDTFDGDVIGNGILPAILHQDPRYFRLGHGTIRHRILYSIATNFMCKSDRTRKWEPNYSNVLGNIASGALSNLYYPSSQSGIGQTIGTGMLVTFEGGLGSVFEEFWPDLSRKFFHKDPTHGLDAQVRAQDQAAKQAKPTQP